MMDLRTPLDREGKKRCTVCKAKKMASEFTYDKRRRILSARCKPCHIVVYRKSRYGVDLPTYDNMLADQDGRCAICRTDNPARRRANHFSVDHCHKTGRVRGLLCYRCNAGLGHFQDSEESMLRAIEYLRR